MVHGKAGGNITEANAVYHIIRDPFKAHFNEPNESKPEPFIDNPRSLDTQMIKDEVAKAFTKSELTELLNMIKYHLNS